MSTDFDTAYDTIVSRVTALLPNHKRLVNVYALEENPDLYLKQGWGLKIGPGGTNSNRLVGATRTTAIQFSVYLTRQVIARDQDPANKAVADKNLLEDLRVLIDDIHKNNFNFSDPIVTFNGFSGIDTVRAGEASYLYVSADLTVEYFIAS